MCCTIPTFGVVQTLAACGVRGIPVWRGISSEVDCPFAGCNEEAIQPSHRQSYYIETPGWMQELEGSHLLCVSTPPVFVYYSSYNLKHHPFQDWAWHIAKLAFCGTHLRLVSWVRLPWAPMCELLLRLAYRASRRVYWCRFLRVCLEVLSTTMCLNGYLKATMI